MEMLESGMCTPHPPVFDLSPLASAGTVDQCEAQTLGVADADGGVANLFIASGQQIPSTFK